jgi:hypothetical protein
MDRKTTTETAIGKIAPTATTETQVKTPATSSSVNGSFQSLESFISASFEANASSLKTLSYNEMAEVPVYEEDALDQLRRNVQLLDKATAQLRFMNREIRYLLKI